MCASSVVVLASSHVGGGASAHLARAQARLQALVSSTRTALRAAVESKADDAIISYLVSNGAKLEISKNEAASKLCSLVEENNMNLLEKWINGGVDVNVADYDKRTALHIAVSQGHKESTHPYLDYADDRYEKGSDDLFFSEKFSTSKFQ